MSDEATNGNQTAATESRAWLDENGYVAFIAEITGKSETHINVSVYSVTGWDMDKTPCDKELYCKAYLKWDGCCHVWFGEEDENDKQDGYLHLCGVKCWKDHIAMMEWLYKMAETEIPRFMNDERW